MSDISLPVFVVPFRLWFLASANTHLQNKAHWTFAGRSKLQQVKILTTMISIFSNPKSIASGFHEGYLTSVILLEELSSKVMNLADEGVDA